MKSKIYIPSTGPEDWRPHLASKNHWKKDHSAISLAHCWQEAKGFPNSILKAFKESGIRMLFDAELLLALPEHTVSLPGSGRTSQNDIFILAKVEGQLISIMVEGKVSEDFDEPIDKWKRDASPGKKKRLNYLCSKLELKEERIQDIRYQLLHRTASAIIEAEKYNTPNAMMLVHSFSPTNRWFDDYLAFTSLFGIDAELDRIYPAGDIGGINLYLGWVKGEEKYLQMEPAN